MATHGHTWPFVVLFRRIMVCRSEINLTVCPMILSKLNNAFAQTNWRLVVDKFDFVRNECEMGRAALSR